MRKGQYQDIGKFLEDHTYPEPNTGCWLWNGWYTKHGYGRVRSPFALGHSNVHRLSYQYHFGDFDRSLNVLHKCDVRCCVNPDHLFLGTHQENMDDMVKKGRSLSGVLNPRAKLTEEQVKEIFKLKEQGLAQRKIASIYGVGKTTVADVLNGKSWSSR